MCGRFTRSYSWQEVHDFLDLKFPEELEIPASYNVAPTQVSPVARNGERGRELAWCRWGLVPSWAKDPSVGSRMINARAETAAEKPAFRAAMKRRRCVVPASGFYEWQKDAGGKKRPHYIARADGAVLLFAGLWEEWDHGDGPLQTFTVLTTAPNELMATLHDRMPVVLEREEVGAWLDPRAEVASVRPMLDSAADGVLVAHEVSARVNSVRADDARLIEPADPGAGTLWGGD
ncbi:MAG: SOS response-associated peptidase [Phycisphaerales bacterium]